MTKEEDERDIQKRYQVSKKQRRKQNVLLPYTEIQVPEIDVYYVEICDEDYRCR